MEDSVGKEKTSAKYNVSLHLTVLKIDCIMMVFCAPGEFPWRKKQPEGEIFPGRAGEYYPPLPNTIPTQVLSALIADGSCSSIRELSAKPTERIICELGVWVSAREANTAEGLRDPPKKAHFFHCKEEIKILFSLLKLS